VQRGVGIVARGQAFDVGFERSRQWNQDPPAGLPRNKPQLARLKVNVRPAQTCDVRKSLPAVEAEKDHAPPFIISHADNCAKLVHSEGATGANIRRVHANRVDKFSRVVSNDSIPLCRFETPLANT
jgi:hypothetical protein